MPRSIDPLVLGRVVGDVLDPFNRSVPIRISYTSKDVTNGCEFKPSAVVSQPRVEIGGDDMRAFYTLVYWFLDISSPSGPVTLTHILTWVILLDVGIMTKLCIKSFTIMTESNKITCMQIYLMILVLIPSS
ncbi:hypothetical protein MKX03_013217 [Papaver bracteatum]|nr:hypothetical protein MKX03_013217 [Papaver bracteatum]